MMELLRHPLFSRLFAAQCVALVGTGLMTVALALLAYDLAGARAGEVLGTALAIKMVAYVAVGPLAAALVERLPPRRVLIAADLARAAAALALPFLTAVWQVYLLIFLLQAASATFTPTFQSVIPRVLTDEARYTRALSLSRMAYEIENLLSPALAGVLLLLVGFHWLFAGTVVGFLVSAMLILRAGDLPMRTDGSAPPPFWTRLTRGGRIYLATPRLRGLLALSFAAAMGVAFVIVNTVVIVKGELGLADSALALVLSAFGGGSLLAALVLPRVLARVPDRRVMAGGALVLCLGLLVLAVSWQAIGVPGLAVLALTWAVLGMAYSAIMTPAGRLIVRSSPAESLGAVFAAQFSLSHACWLIGYLLAGWGGAWLGLVPALALAGGLGLAGTALALRLWPPRRAGELNHDHPDLPADHPHLLRHGGAGWHRHPPISDPLHRMGH